LFASIAGSFKYIGACAILAVISVTFFFFSEMVNYALASAKAKREKREAFRAPLKTVYASLTAPVMLPENASRFTAMVMPSLAFAALLPVTAGISFFLFVPILTDLRDILQMSQYIVLSEFFAVTALYSLGTEKGGTAAKELTKVCSAFFIPFIACLILIAFYTNTSGIFGDPFNILIVASTFSVTLMTPFGIIGSILLLFVIAAQIPYWGGRFSEAPLFETQIEGYDGPQSAMLLLWAMFHSFIAASLVTYIYFPWPFLRDVYSNSGAAWLPQAGGFCAFWITVTLIRNIGAPICAAAVKIIKEKTGEKLAPYVVPVLTAISILLLIYESFRAASEIV
jgi:hypothetical protein